jgi:hypothetical protein
VIRHNRKDIARRVFHMVQEQNPPGQFKEYRGGVYVAIDDEAAIGKTCQALRDQKRRFFEEDDEFVVK